MLITLFSHTIVQREKSLLTEVKTGQVSQISDVMSDKMEAKVPILSAKDARTFMSSLVFGAMPHGQCKCAWISTSYVVGVQSGGNTITEWARFAAPVVTGLMSKGGQQHLRLLVQLLTDMRSLSRLLSASFIGTSSRDLLTFALGVGVWTQATFECNLCY